MGLTIPVLIVLAAFALFVGCYSSYKGGLLDEVMRILCDILMAFPLIVIAMALVSAVDNSVASVIIAIGISMLAWFLRMVRSYAKTECGKEYIEAARISGASGLRIVLRHLLPMCSRSLWCTSPLGLPQRSCRCPVLLSWVWG